MIGIRREKLADQIAVPRMDFHAVEAGFAGQIHRMAEIFHQRVNLRHAQTTHESRRIEIEAAGSAHRHTAAGRPVRHVAAMAQLNSAFRTGGMHRIGNAFEAGHDRFPHPELAVERQTAPVDGSISQRGHPHPAPRHGYMIVIQVLRRTVAVGHVFESGRADDSVAQRHGADGHRAENR